MPTYPIHQDAYYVGRKYNKLEVLKVFRKTNSYGCAVRYAACLCDCGNVCSPELNKVWRGKTRSCGCLQREYIKSIPNLIDRMKGRRKNARG